LFSSPLLKLIYIGLFIALYEDFMTKDDELNGRLITPFESIVDSISIPDQLKAYLPRKWELLGDVVLMKIPPELEDIKEEIAGAYAEELHAKTVLQDLGIEGELREPNVEILWGEETETVHKENGVKFKLDCAKLMFSSGNIDERIRMATIAKKDEVVVDMFAGIGFFSIPMAVHSRPKEIFALEMNPMAFYYLKENIYMNGVGDIVTPVLGDNRMFKKKGIADRIVMGYLDNTHIFIPTALLILKKEGGIIHYHEKCPNELLDSRPLEKVKREVKKVGKKMELLEMKTVKSYAPGVSHVVLDVHVRGDKC
jgi:tRNA wybutosine-synthesizing protein 2